MTEQTSKKLSPAVIGVLLIFAAIPIIAFIKLKYDDQVVLGAVVSIMIGAGAILLSKEEPEGWS